MSVETFFRANVTEFLIIVIVSSYLVSSEVTSRSKRETKKCLALNGGCLLVISGRSNPKHFYVT